MPPHVPSKQPVLLGGADMTYRTQLWIMTVLYALTTAVIFYWVTLFMSMTSEDVEPEPTPSIAHR